MKNSMYSSILFWPLALIFVGFIIFAFNMGMVPSEMAPFWPAILIVIGLIGLIGYMDSFKTTGTTKPSEKKSAKKSAKKARK